LFERSPASFQDAGGPRLFHVEPLRELFALSHKNRKTANGKKMPICVARPRTDRTRFVPDALKLNDSNVQINQLSAPATMEPVLKCDAHLRHRVLNVHFVSPLLCFSYTPLSGHAQGNFCS
jgi:hypothetical protein